LVQQALRERGASANPVALALDGTTGTLSMDSERRIQRSVRWAEITRDSLKLLDDGA
jgi:hypothetical protein